MVFVRVVLLKSLAFLSVFCFQHLQASPQVLILRDLHCARIVQKGCFPFVFKRIERVTSGGEPNITPEDLPSFCASREGPAAWRKSVH